MRDDKANSDYGGRPYVHQKKKYGSRDKDIELPSGSKPVKTDAGKGFIDRMMNRSSPLGKLHELVKKDKK